MFIRCIACIEYCVSCNSSIPAMLQLNMIIARYVDVSASVCQHKDRNQGRTASQAKVRHTSE